MYQLVDDALIAKHTDYVQQGGHLILSARAGQKDKNAHLWELPFGSKIEKLIGSKLLFYDVLPEDKIGTIIMKNQTYKWNNWADILQPMKGTETLATYSNQFYKNKAAATHVKLGKGSVTYIGPDTDDGKLEKEIIATSFTKANIAIKKLPEGLMLDWRDGFWVAVNYHSEKSIQLPVDEKTHLLIGNKLLKPAEVAVWR